MVALGVLLMLHLGLCPREVSARVARDVGNEGQVLIVHFGKTATARRRIKVPAWLQSHLRTLSVTKAPTDLLFSKAGAGPQIKDSLRTFKNPPLPAHSRTPSPIRTFVPTMSHISMTPFCLDLTNEQELIDARQRHPLF